MFLRKEAMAALQVIRGAQKNLIGVFLDSLEKDPFQEGDYIESDVAGRPIQVKVVGQYAVNLLDRSCCQRSQDRRCQTGGSCLTGSMVESVVQTEIALKDFNTLFPLVCIGKSLRYKQPNVSILQGLCSRTRPQP